MKTKIKVLSLAAAAMIALFGCKREGCTDKNAKNYDSKAKKDNATCQYVTGCMDPDAKNYNPDAKKSDNNCTYEGAMIFWWNKTFSDSATVYGISTIKFYIDNVFEGAMAVSQYWNSAPDCDSQGPLTITKDLGTSKSKGYNLTIKYMNGSNEIIATDDEGIKNLTANTCLQFEIPW